MSRAVNDTAVFSVHDVRFPLPRSLVDVVVPQSASEPPTLALSFTIAVPRALREHYALTSSVDSDNYTSEVSAATYSIAAEDALLPAAAGSNTGVSADTVSVAVSGVAPGTATGLSPFTSLLSVTERRSGPGANPHASVGKRAAPTADAADVDGTTGAAPAPASAAPAAASTAPAPTEPAVPLPPAAARALHSALDTVALLDQCWFTLAAPLRWNGSQAASTTESADATAASAALSEAASAVARVLLAAASPLCGGAAAAAAAGGADDAGVAVSVSLTVTPPHDTGAVLLASASASGPLHRENNAWGGVDIIYEQPSLPAATASSIDSAMAVTAASVPVAPPVGLYRLCIAPGRRIPWHKHSLMHESELVLSPHARCCGLTSNTAGGGLASRSLCGCVCHWGPALHSHSNVAAGRWAAVLCVDRPKFTPGDEILAPVAEAAVAAAGVAAAGILPSFVGASPLGNPSWAPAAEAVSLTDTARDSTIASDWNSSSSLPPPWVVADPGVSTGVFASLQSPRSPLDAYPADAFWRTLTPRGLSGVPDRSPTSYGGVSLVPRVVFPGGLPGQRVELRLRCPGQQQQQQQAANDTVAAASAVAAVEPADAVLILAVTTAVTAAMNACTGSGAAGAEPRLIFVKHERRGWELPGGKVDPGEEETQAVLRELKEEAGARWRAVGAPVPLVEYLITEDIERTDSDIAASTASDGPQGRSFGVGVRLGAVGTHLKRVYTVCVEPVESDEALEAETAAVATAPLLLLHPEHLRQSGVSPLLGDQVAAVALRMLQALHYAALRSASGHPTGRE